MIKRIFSFLGALLLCLALFPTECAAAAPDPDRPCSLTLWYTQGGIAFSDLDVEIYRVAKLRADGEHELVEPFSGYPIHIHGITSQKEWQDTAQTIKSYVMADQIAATQSRKTDSAGKAIFTGPETGLYLVKGVTAQAADGTYVFWDFMVYLPTPMGSGYNYNVEARPKCARYEPPAEYTVLKLWNDAGASGQRPASVSVDILKDGAVQGTVTLSSANNWSYSWSVPDGDGDWSVMETDVPAGYQVSMTNSGTAFIITNTKSPSGPDDPTPPDDPDIPDDPDAPDPPEDPDTLDDQGNSNEPPPEMPKTGDTSPLLLYMMLMCISGFGLMLLGFFELRGRVHEKKR
ncbi:MAG: Cna B-type domain-containing protein [Oscillibacter sp.]|nr:Cna B-type domain-containing protein [Oscillibacter sp.]